MGMGARLRRTWARLTPGTDFRGHPGLPLVVADPQHRRDVGVAEGAGGLGIAPEAGHGGVGTLGAGVKSLTAAVRSCSASQAT